MGVYIKDMDMPRNCLACDWCAHTIPADNYICYRLNRAVIGVAEEDVNETVNACCPLVPVPPHGRCIDVDALEDNNITYYAIPVLANVTDGTIREAELVIRLKDLDAAPTIIPAEEGET